MATERRGDRGRRRLQAEAAVLLFAANYSQKLLGFRRLTRTLASGHGKAADPALIARIAAAVAVRADKSGYSCLRRAFAAAWMLRLRGYRPTLHYGVRRGKDDYEAHAWLELDGHDVVGHEEAKAFALLHSFPPAPPGGRGGPGKAPS